ncbi:MULTISPECIES: heavy metal translocating P-type ATPase [Campylobacter]|uniref:heavy metal translocating P-type ATPase n=1 Tax=Campylobacter TaxID=194 RepID=UPI001F220873|nr:cation-translocating P-type ATPase [Campylobacter sp. P0124]MCR8696786.1 cation-translocating P-type ATPase [Campylobacter sp. RM19073]
MNKIELKISGMSCVNCANSIAKSALKIPGIKSANIDFNTHCGVFEYDKEDNIQALKDKIIKLGFSIQSSQSDLEIAQKKELKSYQNKFIISIIISVILMWIEMSQYDLAWLMAILAAIGVFYCGFGFYWHAIKSLKERNYDMNVLIFLGTFCAFCYSIFATIFNSYIPLNLNYLYFSGATMIISFVLLGRYLESKAKAMASSHLKALIDLSPAKAFIITSDGSAKEIVASKLKIGDIVLVKTGSIIPCDGVIKNGGAEIDTSAINGESLPVYRSIAQEVYSGTLVCNGHILIKVTKSPNSTLLAQILELIQTAASKKLAISKLADKISNIFVPSIVAIAVVTFCIWAIMGMPFQGALSAICVLIISCPCALGLATPIAIVCAISLALKHSILIKNPAALEQFSNLKFAVFDKTGTITTGDISVIETNLNKESLSLVASISSLNSHPISKAIAQYAKELVDTKFQAKFEYISGLGIKGDSILIGNERLLSLNSVFIDENNKAIIEQKIEVGYGIVLVAIGGEFSGYITISDTIKPEAKEIIDTLKSQNITPVILSGDNQKISNEVAKKLGIEMVYSEVLPQQKYEIIERLKKSGKVAFIADGINDAAALKSADISIAMNSGSDLAKNSADIILMQNNLNGVIKSINLAKKSSDTIKQNLIWAFGYNAICIPIAAGVLEPSFGIHLTPMWAAFAMSLSSISVVLNSLRLKLSKI